MSVQVRYFTDPACPWSFAVEPELRRLEWEFGDSLELIPVMGGLARAYGSAYRDDDGAIGSGPDCYADLISHWLDIAAETGMPIDPRIWTQSPLTSTYPACIAVKAAQQQSGRAGLTYLRKLREGIFWERRCLDSPEALIQLAGEAGLNVATFRIDVASNALIESFGNDLEEVRALVGEIEDQSLVRKTEGHRRPSFPSMVVIGADGVRRALWGRQTLETYRETLLAAGAEQDARPPLDPAAAVGWLGRAATREVEVLTGMSSPPVAAELWKAAAEWRLRAVPMLTGTVWETAGP